MYQRGMIPGFGLFLLAVLVLFIGGCGDSSTSAITYDEGSASDPYFVNLQMQIEDYLTDARLDFNRGLENIYQLPTDTQEARAEHNAAGPNDTVTAAYVDGWHVTYIARYNLAFNDFFRDSVQFQEVDRLLKSRQEPWNTSIIFVNGVIPAIILLSRMSIKLESSI